jgi:NAD(P)-dependent dehydrogenase (short-subunit alcohol dehydrogenase family)
MNESKRTVVVTGASTGIGEACALHLDRVGFAVFAGVRKDADGEALRQKSAQRITPVLLDVTQASSIQSAVEAVAKASDGRGVAGLVNNAGIAVGGPLECIPLDDLRHQLEVNLIGQVAVTQAFLPLIRHARGRIVNMGSMSGLFTFPFVGPYSASKFALEAVTDALRVELRPWGIQVSIVEPGAIETPIWAKSQAGIGRMLDKLPPQGRTWYGAVIAGIRDRLAEHHGLPAARVAQVVAHALTATRPRTRYVVARGGRFGVWLLRLLPDRLRDWLITRQLPGYR